MWTKAKCDKQIAKQIAPCESTGREILFEWPLYKILSSDSKVRATLENSIIHFGSRKGERKIEKLKKGPLHTFGINYRSAINMTVNLH